MLVFPLAGLKSAVTITGGVLGMSLGLVVLGCLYFLPFFPDDELSYLAGFSSMRAGLFIPIMMLGHIGGSLGLAYVGSGVSYNDPLFIIISLVTLVAGILFFLFYRKHRKSASL